MRVDSVLELRNDVFKSVFGFVESPVAAAGLETRGEPVLVDPAAISLAAAEPARATARALRTRSRSKSEDVALGLTPRGIRGMLAEGDRATLSAADRLRESNGGDSALAVLVQDRRLLNSVLVDDIRAKARDEVEVIYIGRQQSAWTTTRNSPLRLGCSISPTTVGYAGTLGCFCRDNATRRLAILSNNHVLADVNRLAPSTPIMQPGALDDGQPASDMIAALTRFVSIQFGGLPNLVDAAIATLTRHGRKDNRAGVFDGRVPPTRVAKLRPESPTAAAPLMRVMKTGRTTRHTKGVVLAVNVNNVVVNMGVGVARFDSQISVGSVLPSSKPFGQTGDSGSVIVDLMGAPVGLLFAVSASGGPGNLGVTHANPISTVMAQLGITLV